MSVPSAVRPRVCPTGPPPRALALLALALGLAACDPAEKQGQSCPEGSGSVFVEDGPDGPGCYCPAGTVPNATATQCLPADACGAFSRSEGGACVDIDECQEGTAGCDANATCTNVTNAAPRCACKAGYEGDGTTCNASECGPFSRTEGGGCVDIDECQEGTAGCDANATCTNVTNAAPRCACKPGFSGDGTTCTFNGDCGTFARAVDNACVDIDECQEGTAGCAATATCQNNEKAAPTCTCPANNAGDGKTCIPCEAGQKPSGNACVDIDECQDGLDNCAETGSVCTNLSPGFSCRCQAPFVGDGTACACPTGQEPSGAANCVDINECTRDLDDCDPNATCRNTFPGFSCKCKLGFDGDGKHCLPVVCPPGYEFKTSGVWLGTCQDTDECFTNTDGCDANQICINLPGSVRCDCMSSTFVKDAGGHCVCKPGYALNANNNCADANECTNNVAGCSANATCTNLDGGVLCRCKPGFQGDGQTCEPTPCAAGYQTGPNGTGCVDANECALGVAGCSPNANCFNTVGSFTCRCKDGYTGNGQSCTLSPCASGYARDADGICRDIDECLTGAATCATLATCTNTAGSYVCACPAGFVGNGTSCTCPAGSELVGTQCRDINECASGTANCALTASCTDTQGGFVCRCNQGYEGNGQTCTASPCQPGYKTGPSGTCVDLDECAANYDDCSVNATCTNTTGGYLCACKLGFAGSGQVCDPIQCGAGFEFKTSGPNAGSCVDVNECTRNLADCSPNANCVNTSGSFTCACKAGFVGDGRVCGCPAGTFLSNNTCVDLNECSVNIATCGPNATCYNVFASYVCRCNAGYEGDGRSCVATACSAGFQSSPSGCVDTDECANGTADCDPNATCNNTSGAFTCTCKPGYAGTGKTCAVNPCAAGLRPNPATGICEDINECQEGTANCDVNATCNNTSGSFTCRCKNGFSGSGTSCTDIDECAANTDNCAQICTNRVGGFDCSCNPGYRADRQFCQEVNECADAAAVGCFGDCYNTTGGFQCFGDGGVSSLADPESSPYPNMQCAGPVGPEAIWFQTAQKTSFPVDCRCPQGASEPGHWLCAAPTGPETAGVHFGTGPNAADHLNGYLEGCATNHQAKVVYFGVTWGDSRDATRGFIIKVDPMTGDRTVVSGQYYDPALGLREVGTGNRFDKIRDMAVGPDGFLYVFEDSVPGSNAEFEDTNPDLFGRTIYKVDLATGNRTLHWNYDGDKFPDLGHCSNGNIGQVGKRWIDVFPKQFELDEAGNFILATQRNTSPSPGYGFIRVSADARSCSWITREGTEPGNALFGVAAGAGSGVVVSGGFDSGFGYGDGVIYATNFLTGRLFEIDVATGQRSILWSAANPALGTGSGPGVWQFFYYPLFDLWVAGGNEPNTPSYAGLFEPGTGHTWGWMYQRPTPDSTGTVGGGSGSNDTYAGPLGITTNQLKGPILGVLSETLHHRPWCISPVEPDRLLVGTDRVGIVKVEVETGNTMNFSQ